MLRPETQLFLLMSVDGKISTGSSTVFDFDQDLPRVPGVAEGLHQYYELEKQTDEWCLVTGKTMEKIYRVANTPAVPLPVSIVVVDSQHLSLDCVEWLSRKYAQVVIARPHHSEYAFDYGYANVKQCLYQEGNLSMLFSALYSVYYCKKLTVQSGGTLNDALLKAGLIDHVNLVVAPLFVGGATTPTVVDGSGLQSYTNLSELSVLKLVSVQPLENNYLYLQYDVIHTRGVKSMFLEK